MMASRQRLYRLLAPAALLILLCIPGNAQPEYMQQWPQFRGPFASGIVESGKLIHFYAGIQPLPFLQVGTHLYTSWYDNRDHMEGATARSTEWIVSVTVSL